MTETIVKVVKVKFINGSSLGRIIDLYRHESAPFTETTSERIQRLKTEYQLTGKEYSYIDALGTRVGDLVITSGSYVSQIGLALVTNDNPGTGIDKATQPLLGKLDLDTLVTIQNNAESYHNDLVKKQKLLKQIEKTAEATSKLSMFKKLAKDNPELKKLLDEYEKL